MSKDTYTHQEVESLLRKFADKVDEEYRPYTSDNNIGWRIVENFIQELDEEETIEEETIPITYAILKRKIDWNELHEIIHVGYYAIRDGYEIKDTEVFEIPLSIVEKYSL